MLFRSVFQSPSSRMIASNLIKTTALRSLGTKPPPGNPLDMIRKECANRKLCDEHGLRRPGVHWVFSLAVTPDDVNEVCVEMGGVKTYDKLLQTRQLLSGGNESHLTILSHCILAGPKPSHGRSATSFARRH